MKAIISSKTFSCCNGCADRRPGCHSRCKKYKEAHQKHEKLRDKIKKEKLFVMGRPNAHKQPGGFSS